MQRILIWSLLVLSPIASGAATLTAVVDSILDGDTFIAHVNMSDDVRVVARVRIRNVDTPELHGECDTEVQMAMRARDRLAQLLPIGDTVDLRNVKDDKYLGRIDANVIIDGGHDVGKILIDEDLGRPYNGGRRAKWCDDQKGAGIKKHNSVHKSTPHRPRTRTSRRR